MKTISIHTAKTNLSKYIESAKKGETIFIGSHGKPEVKLTVTSPGDLAKPSRKLGQGSGDYWMSDDFDKPDKITDMMINGSI